MKNKKLFITLFTLLFVLLITNSVFADMGAPMINPYEAYVSNPEGADYFQDGEDLEKVGKLDYGTKIEVNSEYEINGEIYANFEIYRIKLKDIKIEDTSKIEDEEIEYNNPTNIKILAKEGVKMYEGPAYAYSELGVTIPNGKKLTAYEVYSDSPWYYVTYNGTSGWICILNGTVGKEPYFEKIIVLNNTKIFDTTEIYEGNDLKESIGVIPANTVFTDFMDVDPWSRCYYVTYNGISGYISHYDCATFKSDYNYEWTVNYKDAKMYKTSSLNGKVIVENIPIGTTLEAEYTNDIRGSGWMYTTYNGKKGWVFVVNNPDYYDEQLEEEKLYGATAKDKVEIDEVTTEEEKDNTIVTSTINTIGTSDNTVNVKKNNTTKVENSKTLSPSMQMILLCVFVGIVIGVTGMGILLLINKKKK